MPSVGRLEVIQEKEFISSTRWIAMDERILVPFDGSPLSERALDRAVTLHPDADIVVLHVIDPIQVVYEAEAKGLQAAETWHERMAERAGELCAHAEERATEHDRSITTATETGSPARAILEYVENSGVDQVIMGCHGRSGLDRAILGSVAETVTRRSCVPVTIVR
jgi:nucleotide-binding universal stress UspA family protein